MSVVVKLGGGLAGVPGALDAVCRTVAAAGRRGAILVVPGGGPFADAVRDFDRRFGLSASSAHAMAILAMDQYAFALAERIDGAARVDEAGAAAEALRRPGVSVLAPSRWMLAADVFPHGWDVTSDSIAAYVAGALDAERLILVKPAAGGLELADPYFRVACPAGLPVVVVGCDRIDDLAAALAPPARGGAPHVGAIHAGPRPSGRASR